MRNGQLFRLTRCSVGVSLVRFRRVVNMMGILFCFLPFSSQSRKEVSSSTVGDFVFALKGDALST